MTVYPQNLHTHGTLCDGKYEYEDTVKKAIERGFESIGFSGHSYTPFDTTYCMTPEKTDIYKKRITELKEKYKDSIDIFCGIEFDMYSTDDLTDYEYTIGSVHYIKNGDVFLEIDPSRPESLKKIADTYYGGDTFLLAKAYFETVAQLPQYINCDIVGHFDLISKHCEKSNIIDTDSPDYKKCALESVTAVAQKLKVFEINVGAIARGYRFTPYPAPFILKRIKELGCSIVLSSDCHDPNFLDDNFDLGIELAKSCGFDELLVLTRNGFRGMKI